MRSTDGQYYESLDHVRGFAAFLVFNWHFLHGPIPTSYVPDFFLFSLFEEGHTGVSVFMTLSGYLFAKITWQKKLVYSKFLWNRLVRLAPLLLLVLLYCFVFRGLTSKELLLGLISPSWPVGAWSITVELHFYVLFPLLLLYQARFGTRWLLLFLVASASLRYVLWLQNGEVQSLAYWTIIGRFDQFLFGMMLARLASVPGFQKYARVGLAASVIGFSGFWFFFNNAGGFYNSPVYPSPSVMWVFIPTVEGLLFSIAIASYERSEFNLPSWINGSLAYVGRVSYSIYLLHFIVLRDFLQNILPMPNDFAQALLLGLLVFPFVVGLSGLSYRFIEQPPLRFRRSYLKRKKVPGTPTSVA